MGNMLDSDKIEFYNEEFLNVSKDKIDFFITFFSIVGSIILKEKSENLYRNGIYKKLKFSETFKKLVFELKEDILYTMKNLNDSDAIEELSDNMLNCLDIDGIKESEVLEIISVISYPLLSYFKSKVTENLLFEEEKKLGRMLDDDEYIDFVAQKVGNRMIAEKLMQLLLITTNFMEERSERSSILEQFGGPEDYIFTVICESIELYKLILES
ncbi:MAG: hypothetical protein LDL13_04445 [Calditerrivibrio sp.]|nr:hypothetical protein [Calditerrivibrio sp.]MCA1932806.1 hypothetical protein [Calditerrivibrio sp.]MCA1980234.1 hypothetical protein [Calditerrivibrio sp.]